MRKKIAAVIVAVGAVGLLAPAVSGAATRSAKVPAVCVQRTIGKVHVQIGYCP